VQNYKIYCSLNNIPIDESIPDAATGDVDTVVDLADVEMDVDGDDAPENGEEWGGLDDEDEDMPSFFKETGDDAHAKEKTPSRNPKSKVALVVRAKVAKVLDVTDLADKRARQCDQNDFLKLLLGMPPLQV
jgi:18S rRNA (adenine1779-N6/adenine1780-N6)-dimethyltransferase